MSAPSAKDIHRSLLEAILDALWIQWRAVGGMTAAKRPARSTVDPEALLLCSLALSEHERRLDDVVHDWVVLNSGFLSVQRVKNLAHAFPPPVAERLGTVAGWALRDGKDARWKVLATKQETPNAASLAPRKPLRRNVRRATTPNLREPAAIMLRLRLGLGIGNKADVVTYLLGNCERSATVREIADGTGYTVHALHRTVDDMATAGLIHSTDDSPTRYTADAEAWRTLLRTDAFTPWCHWFEVYAFAAEFDHWMSETRERVVSAYAFGVHVRELMTRYRVALRRVGVPVPRALAAGEPASEPLEQFALAMRRLIGRISEMV